MLLKGKIRYFIIISVVFTTLYIFIAGEPIKQGVFFQPKWVAKLDRQITDTNNSNFVKVKNIKSKKENFPFLLGNKFGFFSEDGEILYQEFATERISISKNLWSRYTQNSNEASIYSFNNNETPLVTIKKAGYIHLDEDRIYLFEPDGCSVSKYNHSGQEVWRIMHSAPITTFNSSKAGAIIGYTDGKLIAINKKGEILFDFYPGGSNYQVILGAAISDDKNYALCICGLEKQRVILIKITENHHKIVYHSFLKKELRQQVFIDFDDENKYGIFESGDGIGIIDCDSYEISFINEKGIILSVGKKTKNNVMTLLIQNDIENTILAVSPPSTIIGKTKFKAKNSFLIQNKDMIYIGCDDKITSLRLGGLKK